MTRPLWMAREGDLVDPTPLREVVLGHLRTRGPATATDLAEAIGRPLAQVSGCLNGLAGAGLTAHARGPDDLVVCREVRRHSPAPASPCPPGRRPSRQPRPQQDQIVAYLRTAGPSRLVDIALAVQRSEASVRGSLLALALRGIVVRPGVLWRLAETP